VIFAIKCGCHVHNANVIVQQPLSASSVIFVACVSVAVVYICKKLLTQKLVLNSKLCHCSWQVRQLQAKKDYFFCISVYLV